MGKKSKQKAKSTPSRHANTTKTPTGTNTPHPSWSLRDELTNTEKHRSEWTRETRLRDQRIGFVSAGSIEPLDEPKTYHSSLAQSRPGNLAQSQSNTLTQPHHHTDLLGSENAMAQMDINSVSLDDLDRLEMDLDDQVEEQPVAQPLPEELPVFEPTPEEPPVAPPEEQPAFFIDTEGDTSLAFKGPKSTLAPRAPSPAASDSSDEVVFRGRAGVTIRDDPPVVKPASKPASKPRHKSASKPVSPDHQNDVNLFLKALDDPPEWAHMLMKGPEINQPRKQYLDNAEDWQSSPTHQWPSVEEALGFTDRLDEDLSAVRPSRKGKKTRKKQNRVMRLDKDLEDELMRDYIANIAANDMPTSGSDDDKDSTDGLFDELLNDKEQDQDGEDVDVTALEAEWTDEDSAEEDEEDEDEDSSELEERLEKEEREAWEDDEDIREKAAEALADEELARLFAKQQELGFGGDDIVIFDDRFGDVGAARSGLPEYALKTGTKKGKKKSRKSDQFPDASLLADVLEQDPYGGFDVMDYERPSLRPTPKGRKSAGALPEELAGLSDDDLIQDLKDQWSNDRSKKAKKKAEREELRQLGMIGKKNKFKPDLNQRYGEGITMVQVKFELREFLEQEDHSTKAFPPMLKNDRKTLHELANHFNLKSKSVGSGKNRAPVLIKTSRTIDWSESHFARVQNMVGRGYLKNSSRTSRSTFASEARKGRRDGAGTGAASYRNGDVVGQHASEIPETNFGRKLMEKMGWSVGMSLGKEGSSGLLVPVQATMKSGKAGLG